MTDDDVAGDVDLSWDYFSDNTWYPLGDDEADALTIACFENKFQVTYRRSQLVKFKFDLSKMIRSFDGGDGEIWPLRCSVLGSSPASAKHVWSYTNEDKVDCLYNPREMFLLEEAFENHEITEIQLDCGKNEASLVNVRNMIMTNGNGNRHFKVHRDKIENCWIYENQQSRKRPRSPDENLKVLQVSLNGQVPVDVEFFKLVLDRSAEVYCTDTTEEQEPWTATLNMTDIQQNINKYVILQLLVTGTEWIVWRRSGRVGTNGQYELLKYTDAPAAKWEFRQMFYTLTGNDWDMRPTFSKVSGKYDMVVLDYDIVIDPKKRKIAVEYSSLDQRIIDLINIICDIKEMEQVLTGMQYDIKKSPLGQLSEKQIESGYECLKEIEVLVQMKTVPNNQLVDMCNAFYAHIPHYFGPDELPRLITSMEEVAKEYKLLETLRGIEASLTAMDASVDHPADTIYKSLDCELIPLLRNDPQFLMVQKYINNSLTPNIQLLEVFTCKRAGEEKRFIDKGYRTLLWHGSLLSNWPGIMKQGLLIKPPGIPHNGSAHGNGVYFADNFSTSYSFSLKSGSGMIVLALCVVSIGNDRSCAIHVNGCAEDPFNSIYLRPHNVLVPSGTGNGIYVVFDIRQIKLQYLVQVRSWL